MLLLHIFTLTLGTPNCRVSSVSWKTSARWLMVENCTLRVFSSTVAWIDAFLISTGQMIWTLVVRSTLRTFTLNSWVTKESLRTYTLSSVSCSSTFGIDSTSVVQARILTIPIDTGFSIRTVVVRLTAN